MGLLLLHKIYKTNHKETRFAFIQPRAHHHRDRRHRWGRGGPHRRSSREHTSLPAPSRRKCRSRRSASVLRRRHKLQSSALAGWTAHAPMTPGCPARRPAANVNAAAPPRPSGRRRPSLRRASRGPTAGNARQPGRGAAPARVRGRGRPTQRGEEGSRGRAAGPGAYLVGTTVRLRGGARRRRPQRRTPGRG